MTQCSWCSDPGEMREIRQWRTSKNKIRWRMPPVPMVLCDFCATEAEGVRHQMPPPRYVKMRGEIDSWRVSAT